MPERVSSRKGLPRKKPADREQAGKKRDGSPEQSPDKPAQLWGQRHTEHDDPRDQPQEGDVR